MGQRDSEATSNLHFYMIQVAAQICPKCVVTEPSELLSNEQRNRVRHLSWS